jgi:cobalt-zinc-cadmium efflux system membrane fusion protein
MATTNIFIRLSFTGLLTLLISCREHPRDSGNQKLATGCISSELVGMIDTTEVRFEEVEEDIQFTGKIDFDESKVIPVYALLSGVVKSVNVELGDFVKTGQVLATVQSADVATMQSDYLDAQSDLIVSQRQYNASQQMLKGGLSSEKEVLTSKEEYKKAQNRVEKMKDMLRIYQTNRQAEFNIVAPSSGYVVKKALNKGMDMRSDNTDPVFVVGSIDQVWAVASVFETDLERVKTGLPVLVTVSALPGKTYTGTIAKITEVLDPVTRTVQARIELKNQDKLLKPEMFASITAQIDEGKKRPVVPVSSIVFDDPMRYVVLWNGACGSKIQAVKVISQNDSIAFVDNLPVGAKKVVSQGSLSIYTALKR